MFSLFKVHNCGLHYCVIGCTPGVFFRGPSNIFNGVLFSVFRKEASDFLPRIYTWIQKFGIQVHRGLQLSPLDCKLLLNLFDF